MSSWRQRLGLRRFSGIRRVEADLMCNRDDCRIPIRTGTEIGNRNCGCGYDVQESMEKLMNMSTTTLDLGNATSSMVDQTCEDLQDLEVKSERKLQVIDSTGSYDYEALGFRCLLICPFVDWVLEFNRSNIEREILGKLFTSKVGPTPTLPRREPRTRKYGVVTGPLKEPVTECKSPIVIKEANGDDRDT
ncbi:hypothetical protein L2E82_51286 [Cichorium intybus]|nr:hypothetical protein L2E82_51286 [Cichorium intybus]